MKKIISTAIALVMLMISVSSIAATKSLPTQPVNINTAAKAELMTLPGVGEAKADAIISMRSDHSFKTAEDLLAVKGIGQKLLEKMIPYVSVNDSQKNLTK